jgi:hypothetical protein
MIEWGKIWLESAKNRQWVNRDRIFDPLSLPRQGLNKRRHDPNASVFRTKNEHF